MDCPILLRPDPRGATKGAGPAEALDDRIDAVAAVLARSDAVRRTVAECAATGEATASLAAFAAEWVLPIGWGRSYGQITLPSVYFLKVRARQTANPWSNLSSAICADGTQPFAVGLLIPRGTLLARTVH